jgi:hypothetical protein
MQSQMEELVNILKNIQLNKGKTPDKNVKCFNCGQMGHIRPKCPALKQDKPKYQNKQKSNPN